MYISTDAVDSRVTGSPQAASGDAPAADLSIAVAGPADAAAWDVYVQEHPQARPYQLWRWRSVFEDVFGHRATYLMASRGGRVSGVLPLVEFHSWLFGRFLISLPFVNYGGILADDEKIAAALAARAADLVRERGLTHVEMRHLSRQLPALPARQHKVTMLFELPPDAETGMVRLDRRVRNHVKKAEKSGLVGESGGPELLDDFYPVFARNMRDLGTPVYPRRFFEAVVRGCGSDARVFCVRLDGKPLAGSIVIGFRDIVEVPWASSLKEYRSLNANTLLYWEMIKWATGAGFRTFDFGRSTPGDGPYQFKAQWGAQPHQLSWEYALAPGTPIPDQSPKNPKFELAIRLWQHLPVPVATALGPSIIRSIP